MYKNLERLKICLYTYFVISILQVFFILGKIGDETRFCTIVTDICSIINCLCILLSIDPLINLLTNLTKNKEDK
jgi:hypothetical protein